MKHVKIYETTFRTPGLRNAKVGKYLCKRFFTNGPQFHFEDEQPYEVVESEDANKKGESKYSITMKFSDLSGQYFDSLVELKNFLEKEYNSKNICIIHDINSRDENKVRLEIVVEGDENVEKLKNDGRMFNSAKKYNI